MSKRSRCRVRWLVLGGAVAVAGAISLDTGLQLAACRVPGPALVICVLSVFTTLTAAGDVLADALTTTTYRCPVPGCSFRARLRTTDPGALRRGQEAAASHPIHH
ncbi:hypothetical protein [Streptomyces huiliensis]|uniref:hypothetical protein n=1 Tax=Streptomyces huiliensis TaxID=2876027 RepID=UPI001CBF1B7B|nr:hypothetical protein [Streptomyces huiliensis]MBZ4322486.1 hypothetical protein [Streptomyces huiliensis]